MGDAVVWSVWYAEVSLQELSEDWIQGYHNSFGSSAEPQWKTISIGRKNITIEEIKNDERWQVKVRKFREKDSAFAGGFCVKIFNVFREAQLRCVGNAKIGKRSHLLDFFATEIEDLPLLATHVENHDLSFIYIDVKVVCIAILLQGAQSHLKICWWVGYEGKIVGKLKIF